MKLGNSNTTLVKVKLSNVEGLVQQAAFKYNSC